MAQRDPDSTERRLEVLTDRFDDFADETREFMEETRSNREADNRRFDDFVKEVRDDFAYFRGREYERVVCHTLLSPVSHRLGLRRPRLVHSVAFGISEDFRIHLEDYPEEEDLFEVTLSDAIVRGTFQGSPAYAVIEISVTIGDRGITRAADRAQKLEQASKVRTFPVAIGQHIPKPQQSRADAMNVTLIQISE